MPRVSLLSGQARTTMSAPGNKRSMSPGAPTASARPPVSGVRRTTVTLAPNALARRVISWPMGPKPITSQCVCDTSRNGVIFQVRSACRARWRSMGCITASTWPSTYSEMATPWALLLQMQVPLADMRL